MERNVYNAVVPAKEARFLAITLYTKSNIVRTSTNRAQTFARTLSLAIAVFYLSFFCSFIFML